MTLCKLGGQIVRFIVVQSRISCVLLDEVGLVANQHRYDSLILSSLDFFVELLELDNGVGVGQVVDVEYSVEVLESSFLDILEHAVAIAVPLYRPMTTTVRLTSRWWFIFIFLKRRWKPLVGGMSWLNFYR